MKCRDGTEYPDEWFDRLSTLFEALDVIREAWGGPLVIVSGYRSPQHNEKVGGAQHSQHMQGRAVDLRPIRKPLTSGDIHKLHHVVNRLIVQGLLPNVGGVGVYPLTRNSKTHLLMPGWIHVDTRPKPSNGHIAHWTGEKFGDEQST